MSTEFVYSFEKDLNLHPLYFKWAADSFSAGRVSEAMQFFQLAKSGCSHVEQQVYRNLQEMRDRPAEDNDEGRTFCNIDSQSFSATDKARAIRRCLEACEQNELRSRENLVHWRLWLLQGSPIGDPEYGRHAFEHTHGKSSSFAEKIEAARQSASLSRVFTLWTASCDYVLVRKASGELELVFLNRNSGIVEVRNFEADVSELASRYLDFNGGNPCFRDLMFSKPIRVEDNRLSFWSTEKNGSLWRFWDKERKVVSFIPEGDETSLYRFYSYGMGADQARLNGYDFVASSKSEPSGRLQSVSIYPPTKNSQLDVRKVVNATFWSFTLVNAGPCCNLDPGFGHAAIVYEGIEGSRYFSKMLHINGDPLRGRATVLNKDCTGRSLDFKNKTPTLVSIREVVLSMLSHYGLKLNDEVGVELPFSLKGKGAVSAGSTSYNCVTFTEEVFGKCGIVVPPSNGKAPDEYISSIASAPFSAYSVYYR